MSLESLSSEYDHIYEEADKILKEYNPCQFEKGKCVHNRAWVISKNGCCNGCNELGPNGCEIKSLGCKLYLCSVIRKQDKECFEKIEQLGLQTKKAFGTFPSCFTPKDSFLKIREVGEEIAHD